MKPINRIFILFLVAFSLTANAQDDKSSKPNKVTYKIKMNDARHQYLNGNIRGGLNIYRELLKSYTNDAMINYRIGECYLDLKEWQLAVEYIQNAKKINPKVTPELGYKLGYALHRNNQLDLAEAELKEYKSNLKKKNPLYDADKILAQVEFAKKMMFAPVKVEISNLGKNVNSRGGDYAPSLTADGQTMIFTSRRADTKGGGVDKAGDYKYYEDIYLTKFDSTINDWTKANPIEGKLNTEGHDASLSISPDGNQIYIYRNDGSVYIGDIFVSKKRRSGAWGEPTALDKQINSSYFESSASLSADGTKLYFVSERQGKKYGANGKGDIYVVEKISRTVWGEPRNLGSVINTPEDEISVFIHPDGKTLFFSSKGHLSMGGYDIFSSRLQMDGTWSTPENLGYPINTVDDDVHFVLSTDGKIAYYSTVREDGLGERDIYQIDLKNYDLLKGTQKNLSIVKGSIEAKLDGLRLEAVIEFKDEKGELISSINTEETGDFLATLPGNIKYSATISALGYKAQTINFDLPIGEEKTYILVKNIVLEQE
ncbi:MAG: PD40 domain-containing protein [Flavobacteriales bacterium]|nr:PD40 domain-containing protein [Flavobacteriales bacterium]MCL4857034.1 PD40 domain-containing protein [Flavobacteriales bacterium]